MIVFLRPLGLRLDGVRADAAERFRRERVPAMRDGAKRLEPYIREMYYRAAGESFPLGEIGQNAGWRGVGYNDQGGAYGSVPAVVELPGGNRAVELHVPDAYGASSYLDFTAADLPALRTGRLTIRFDLLRQRAATAQGKKLASLAGEWHARLDPRMAYRDFGGAAAPEAPAPNS